MDPGDPEGNNSSVWRNQQYLWFTDENNMKRSSLYFSKHVFLYFHAWVMPFHKKIINRINDFKSLSLLYFITNKINRLIINICKRKVDSLPLVLHLKWKLIFDSTCVLPDIICLFACSVGIYCLPFYLWFLVTSNLYWLCTSLISV